MATERLEVRLDPDLRRQLRELAKMRGVSVSDVVRSLIQEEYEECAIERRKALVREMASLNIEDVPDPDTLSRQLESTHDLGDLYRR